MLAQIQGIIATLGWRDIVDILLVAFLLYKLYGSIKDTRAVALLKGLTVILAATLVSKWLGLNVINWLLQKTLTIVMVALPVVFQPELRRTLEQLGRGKLFRKSGLLDEEEQILFWEKIGDAVGTLSKNKIGALLVMERETGLGDYVETGIQLDALVSSEFLVNLFIPNTPLHDGAAIVRDNRVVAAGCLLPLTEDTSLNKELGTRHRAAIGITEQTDAVVVVVSEETGVISVAKGGQLTRYMDPASLKNTMRPLFASKATSFDFFNNWRFPSQ